MELKTAFQIHMVISILFIAPIFALGMNGFMDLLSEGKLKPDAWHKIIFGVDFVKNLMITAQTYAATTMGRAEQEVMAKIFVGMCLGCLANMYVHEGAPPPAPPPIIYCTVVPAVYAYALSAEGDSGKKKK